MSRSLRLATLTVALATVAACSSAPDATAPSVEPAPGDPAAGPAVEPLELVVTTSILGDLVRRLVEDDGTVRVLMDPGVDPHTYAPSAADAAAMRDADLVVVNGLALEEGLIGAIEAAVADGVRVLALAPELDPIAFVAADHAHDDDHADDQHAADDHAHDGDHAHDDDHADDDHADDEHADDGPHDHGALDPHVWFDPLRMATGLELAASALTDLRPEVGWASRAAALRDELEVLDAELTAAFAAIPEARRRLVTNHDSLGYLADRYGFTVIGTVIPGSSTAAETNPAAFAALADLLVEEGIDVVFTDSTDSETLARQLAAEVVGRGGLEVRVVALFTGSLGPDGSGAETYVGMLRTDAERIVDALAG